MGHIKNLEQVVGDLKGKKILDVGAGWGGFLIEGVSQGYDIIGLEIDKVKIEGAYREATRLGLKINLVEGLAENLPFLSDSFDFVNVGEVIEHVRDPKKVLGEIQRVLKPSGKAYVSVHNRFGLYDTHFHLFFLGWLPRSSANHYISLFNKHKDYINAVDVHNIQEMHYFTFNKFSEIARDFGFKATDIREIKINKKYSIMRLLILFLYKTLSRPLYFSTFHILLTKNND
jgi:2-polyprenyl-3-methyl-5-hydroxy-6-metoxy-1,4-benzoquinol methylase